MKPKKTRYWVNERQVVNSISLRTGLTETQVDNVFRIYGMLVKEAALRVSEDETADISLPGTGKIAMEYKASRTCFVPQLDAMSIIPPSIKIRIKANEAIQTMLQLKLKSS